MAKDMCPVISNDSPSTATHFLAPARGGMTQPVDNIEIGLSQVPDLSILDQFAMFRCACERDKSCDLLKTEQARSRFSAVHIKDHQVHCSAIPARQVCTRIPICTICLHHSAMYDAQAISSVTWK